MKELHKKIFDLRHKIGKMSKDLENPFYKSKYFDINKLLEHLDPLLYQNNLLILQPIIDNKVITRIIDIETSQIIESSILLPDLSDPQKIGSAITYYRRYALQSLLGIQAEDDDGNKASVKEDAPEKEWLNVGSKAWNKALEKQLTIPEIENYYRISKANKSEYLKQLENKIQ